MTFEEQSTYMGVKINDIILILDNGMEVHQKQFSKDIHISKNNCCLDKQRVKEVILLLPNEWRPLMEKELGL